eukprot:TRINITY_DN68062_c5_g10_i2.p1 TRINITY_DN68062_c5_g10~~TRINITY_DN68062_c5_g10_i2.p1  ORF type:complete len:368 (+),score=34.31 TRINITY_DN68062_c5_g10_i2:33-1136(+)
MNVVVGAGVVGLAVARRLALSGKEVLVLEKAAQIGTMQSSRNSEVIHAGMYYVTGSNKAKFCVRGRNMLYDYLRARQLPHRQIGKIIVATSEDQVPVLEKISKQAVINGVHNLEWLDGKEVAARDPNVFAVRGLWSPSTGILDSHALMQSFRGELEDNGGVVVCNTTVLSGSVRPEGGVLLTVDDGDGTTSELECDILINSAGIDAPNLAAKIDGLDRSLVYEQLYAKGSYFQYTGKNPFNHLIYPVPTPGGLGTHCTIDMGGQCRFGPDVEWITEPNYDVHPEKAEKFYKDVRAWFPGLKDGTIAPGYSGIRAKVTPPGAEVADFVFQGPKTHGIKGFVNLLGMESPGLTSCLAIAEEVLQLVEAE